MPEIDEEELRRLRTLQGAVQQIWSNPEARLMVQKAQKLVDPRAVTPDLDQQQVTAQPVEDIRKELNEFKAATAKEREDREQAQKLTEIRSKISDGISQLRRAGWTDDGIKGVEKIMEERGIIDPDIAAAYFEKNHPPQAPAMPGGTGSWNFLEMPKEGDGADDLKKLIESRGNDEPLLRKMSSEALSEIRQQTRR